MQATLEALADTTRRRIVEELAEQDQTAGELAELFDISRPGVSRHLRVLRHAGLVQSRAEAQRRVYSLQVGPLDELERWVSRTRSFWTGRLDALETEIERGQRPRKESGR